MNDDDNDDEPKKDPYNLVREHFLVCLYHSIPVGDCEFLYRTTLEMFEHNSREICEIIDGDYGMAEDEAMLVEIMDALTQP